MIPNVAANVQNIKSNKKCVVVRTVSHVETEVEAISLAYE